MFVSERLVGKYQKTYEKKFGEKISAKQAERELSDLAELVKLTGKGKKPHGK